MLERSGANKGMGAGFGNGHRREQPAVMAREGASVELDHCALIDGVGQVGHAQTLACARACTALWLDRRSVGGSIVCLR